MTPTMSDPCSIALNAPVTAKAIVPNMSRICMNTGTGKKTSDKITTAFQVDVTHSSYETATPM
jgi:hypothetical protein